MNTGRLNLVPFWTVLRGSPRSRMRGLRPVPVLSKPRYPVSLTSAMTGHYARKTWDTDDHLSKPRPMLRKPLDATKDQTYYLSSISENSLSRALFPLSRLTKAQVRNLASEWHLPTATRDESMGLCFVGERKKFSEFICRFPPRLIYRHELRPFSAQYIVPKPGPIVDMTTGKQAGVHQGLWSYTIGQGAKISGVPQRMFVAKKDPEANTIFVVPGA